MQGMKWRRGNLRVHFDGQALNAVRYFESNCKDWQMRKIALWLLLAMSIGVATTASSQTPPSGIRTADPAWKVPEIIAFIGLKKGDKVADIIGGRLTASLAQAVGPTGKVYAVETAEIVKGHPHIMDMMKGLATQYRGQRGPRCHAAAVGTRCRVHSSELPRSVRQVHGVGRCVRIQQSGLCGTEAGCLCSAGSRRRGGLGDWRNRYVAPY